MPRLLRGPGIGDNACVGDGGEWRQECLQRTRQTTGEELNSINNNNGLMNKKLWLHHECYDQYTIRSDTALHSLANDNMQQSYITTP